MSATDKARKPRIPAAAVTGMVLAALCGLALYLRITLPYDQVFVGEWVWFRDTDAYYYLRHIENLVRNFPHFNSFDPYMLYPGGGGGPFSQPLFAGLIASVSRAISVGAPSLRTIQTVAAYMPAILGTLTLIPIYFIGRELFNRWAGLLAAALAAILPGEFLHRSLLGFTDHHVAEVLLSTMSMLFFIMAIKRAREREVTFRHLLTRDWSVLAQPLVHALLAGLLLGLYFLAWQGGLLFLLIVFACLVVQFIADHMRDKPTDYLCLVGVPLFLTTTIVAVTGVGATRLGTVTGLSLSVAIAAPVVLHAVSRALTVRKLRRVYYPVVLLALVGIMLAALRVVSPTLLRSALSLFSVLIPGSAMRTVMEVQPLLWPTGELSFRLAWYNFTTAFFISLVALAMIGWRALTRTKDAGKNALFIWSLIALLAVLGQRRFGYYFAVNAALLTGYLCEWALSTAGIRRLVPRTEGAAAVPAKAFKKRKKSGSGSRWKTLMQPRGTWLKVTAVAAIVFLLAFFPNIGRATSVARSTNIVMSTGWQTSLEWLKDNSPEPFGDPGYYYELYPSRDNFEYPETFYTVLSWWDYGYFIMQIGHRVPGANPSQGGAKQAGRFFTAQDEATAREMAVNLSTRYVMIDYPMSTGKFYAMVEWAGLNRSDYFDVYYQRTEQGTLSPITLYHESYYRSMAVRLYSFEGQAVVPEESIVISYEGRTAPGGVPYKEITSAQFFDTYGEAAAYLADQTGDNYIVVGPDPFKSPVPLEALQGYQLIYQTEGTHPVKIFEYLGP